ncbi:antA/AntB antirepressor family protein [Methylorubrum thiocyanatum]|uniref:antA/AntB antirepressor family protein n=1 Tax=Methylorubrum thiocyanatum TaxID=47958 RepID=UPI003F7EECD7
MRPVDSGPIPKPAETSEGTDYVKAQDVCSPNLANSTSSMKTAIEYHLTLDTAKEIAMIDHRYASERIRATTASFRLIVATALMAD